MALSRSMKDLMHQAAQARHGGGNPTGGVMGRYNPGPKLQRRAPMPDRGPRGPARPTGKPRPGAGTFGFAAQRGRTPALQQATAGAKMQAMRQAAAPRAAAPAAAGVARPAAAFAEQRGAAVRDRVGARQGPPARRGGMARALGSGGSRRRMLR